MGVNLKSSCHGRASWGNSNPSFDLCVRACAGPLFRTTRHSFTFHACLPSTDRNKAVEQIANFVIDNHPDWQGLFFVDGVSEVQMRAHA